MTDAAAATVKPRRWPQVAALAVVLPLALAVHSWYAAREWLRYSDLFPVNAVKGQAAALGGADWRLADLRKLSVRKDGAAVVAAVLEAKLLDKAKFEQMPCLVKLTAPGQPVWMPAFILDSEMGDQAPELADAPTCGRAQISAAKAGDVVKIVEFFTLPEQMADQVQVELSLQSARPYYLVFDRP